MTKSRGERASTAVVAIFGIPLAITFGIWLAWITWTAFAGGQAPFFPYEFTDVSIGRGLLWLFIIDPIVATVAYWGFMLVMLPVIALVAAVGTFFDRRRR